MKQFHFHRRLQYERESMTLDELALKIAEAIGPKPTRRGVKSTAWEWRYADSQCLGSPGWEPRPLDAARCFELLEEMQLRNSIHINSLGRVCCDYANTIHITTHDLFPEKGSDPFKEAIALAYLAWKGKA